MKEKYKISIVIPIYNVEKYLYKCLQSVLSQTFDEIQVIMVDDGSKDRSGEIADVFAEKYDNFQVIHKENGGLADARNCGMKYVLGEYVIFLDSDDMLEINACKLLYKKAKEEDSDIVIGRPVWKYEDDTIETVQYLNRWFEKNLSSNFRHNFEIAIGFPVVTSKLFRTSLIKENKIRFPIGISGEDVVFSVYTFYKAKKIHIIPDIVYLRTERKDNKNPSITQQASIKVVEDRIQVIKLIDKYCDENHLKLIKKHNRKATLDYILRTIERIDDDEQKRKSFVLVKEFIDYTFKDKREISKYIDLTYEEIVMKSGLETSSRNFQEVKERSLIKRLFNKLKNS